VSCLDLFVVIVRRGFVYLCLCTYVSVCDSLAVNVNINHSVLRSMYRSTYVPESILILRFIIKS